MANELKIKLKVDYKPATEDSLSTYWLEKYISMTGTEFIHGIQSIGITEEAIEKITDIATIGFCVFKNLDSTNYIEIGLTGSYSVKLKAREIAMFRADADLYALADTGACRLEYWIFED